MKTKILLSILGGLLTLSLVYLYNSFVAEITPTETYTPQFVTNQETGASGRLMEADIIYYDTDNDGEEENIILFSCYLCNASPRELAIIDDGELVFFYEGGQLEFIPIEPGSFIIDEANIPTDGRRNKTQFSYSKDNNQYFKTQ